MAGDVRVPGYLTPGEPPLSIHRVAVIQAGSVLFDTASTLDKLIALTGDAASRGAKLVVFPEAFIGGYPKGLGFGARMGSRTPEGREEFRRYLESAIDVPSPATEQIGKAAREHGVYLVVGIVERAGSTLYCTALFFGSDGSLLAKHRKLMPTAMERLVWGQGDGSTLPVIETPVGKTGAVICWENYMPLLRTAMYAKGVEVYCAVTVDDRDTWLPTMRHVALEGRCFVLSACQLLTRKDCPPDYDTNYGVDPNAVLIRGGSCVVGPLGQVLAGPVFGEEAILTADIDLDDIPRARFDFDPVGHYARPDVFKLVVNEAQQMAVEFGSPTGGNPTAPLRLIGVPGTFAVCRLPAGSPVPDWATTGEVWTVSRTADELSVVCPQDVVPTGVTCELGWRCLRVAGAMPFTLVGVPASLTAPVARAGVGVFAFSTFDTDYLLVKAGDFPTAVAALRAVGHTVEDVLS
jgi:nitrilase